MQIYQPIGLAGLVSQYAANDRRYRLALARLALENTADTLDEWLRVRRRER